MSKVTLLIFIFTLPVTLAHARVQETAQNLFSQYGSALFQIQIIDLESDKKSSIGSGFQVSADGKIISNYHVVSAYINAPEKYRIRFINSDGQTGQLQLLHFDIVNDLVLLKRQQSADDPLYFRLAKELPDQGTTLFSLGNPHDLGMIVVPGTFNGLKKKSYHQRIHFTGSINPGMSGGPALNEAGEVVGVNVATAGNQIGFLVPLHKIQDMTAQQETIEPQDYLAQIEQQLYLSQAKMMERMLATPWQSSPLGRAMIPKSIASFISCWGNSNADDEQSKIRAVANRCQLGESIFVNNHLQTGEVEIEYEWLNSEELSQLRFYRFLSSHTANARPGNRGTEDDLTNFECQHNIVTNRHNLIQKATLCVRNYKKFTALYDVLFISTSIDHPQSGLVSHFTLSGVSQASANMFTKQFLDSVKWQ